MQTQYSISINANQVIFNIGEMKKMEIDSFATALISQTLREKFEPKKRNNIHLADAYQLSGLMNGSEKALRLLSCGRWLEFAVPSEAADKRYKVTKTSSCHVRLCPVCQWRRSINSFRNLAEIYNAKELADYKHVFVTLTQKNVSGENLKDEIKKISDAYTAMMRRKPFKDIIAGYTRTIEITYGKNGYHPHIHAIWTVKKNYGKKDYISQKMLSEEWGAVLNLDYTPVVDIRIIKNFSGKTVAEVAKYSVKPSDYIQHTVKNTSEIIKILDPALDGKRFISFGGIIREIKKNKFGVKNLEDLENDSISDEWKNWERIIYEWHFLEGRYKQRK